MQTGDADGFCDDRNKCLYYTLNRSERKTIAIRITKDATIEVGAPLKMPKSDINKFVQSKEKWITKHLLVRMAYIEQKAKFSLDYGDMVLYRGREYPIIMKSGDRIGFDGSIFYMCEGLSAEEIKFAVIQLYKKLAKRDLTIKVIDFAKQMNVRPIAVKINSAKTRWGSCSGKNSINFSWRLIMADDAAIDYVVVHELAHIKEHNHSSRFWDVVKNVFPDYIERQNRLRALQVKLSVENWE